MYDFNILEVYLWRRTFNCLDYGKKEMKMKKKEETTVQKAIQDFIDTKLPLLLNPKDCYIYNEFSLQHELGIHLRNELKEQGYKIQFERNIDDVNKQYFKTDFSKTLMKKEMDIYIRHGNDHYAIELKFPLKKQSAREVHMYHLIEDIVFMKQAKNMGFKETFVLTLVNDPGYYKQSNRKCKEVYKIFRQPSFSISDNKIKIVNESIKGQYTPFPDDLDMDQSFDWNTILNQETSDYRYYFESIK